jgi:Flp pilus assembly protein TadG
MALRKLISCERGSALVEAAITLPIFLILVGGVYEFSFYFYQQQLAAAGVRDAARYLALTNDPTTTTNQSAAKNLAVYGLADGGSAARVGGWSTADVTVSVDLIDNAAGAYSGGLTIKVVTVATSFPDPSLGFFPLLGLAPPKISVSHQERSVGGSAAIAERSS